MDKAKDRCLWCGGLPSEPLPRADGGLPSEPRADCLGVLCNNREFHKEFYMEKEVSIELDISDEDFLVIAKAAHKNDVTFNQMVTILLQRFLDKEEEKK